MLTINTEIGKGHFFLVNSLNFFLACVSTVLVFVGQRAGGAVLSNEGRKISAALVAALVFGLEKKSTNSLPIFAGLGKFNFTLDVDGDAELVVAGEFVICDGGDKVCSGLGCTSVSAETPDSNDGVSCSSSVFIGIGAGKLFPCQTISFLNQNLQAQALLLHFFLNCSESAATFLLPCLDSALCLLSTLFLLCAVGDVGANSLPRLLKVRFALRILSI